MLYFLRRHFWLPSGQECCCTISKGPNGATMRGSGVWELIKVNDQFNNSHVISTYCGCPRLIWAHGRLMIRYLTLPQG